MAGAARRLAVLAVRASCRQQSKLLPTLPACGQVRHFAVPATSNEDEYKRFQSVKEKAHITVRAGTRGRVQGKGRAPWRHSAWRECAQCDARAARVVRSGRRCATSRWLPSTRRWCVPRSCAVRGCGPLTAWWRHTDGHHRAREEPSVEGA